MKLHKYCIGILFTWLLMACQQPLEDTNTKIIAELERLQQIVYHNGSIADGATENDITAFGNYISEHETQLDVTHYRNIYTSVAEAYNNAADTLHQTEASLPQDSAGYTAESWERYQQQISSAPSVGDNPSYSDIRGRNEHLQSALEMLILTDDESENNPQEIIAELERLQQIVYHNGSIADGATENDITAFGNYISEQETQLDITHYRNIYTSVAEAYNNTADTLRQTEASLPQDSAAYTAESWERYQQQISSAPSVGDNPSYSDIRGRNEHLQSALEMLILAETGPTIFIGGTGVDSDNTITIRDITDSSFDVDVKAENTIKEIIIHIEPDTTQAVSIRKLYDMSKALQENGITATIYANDRLTYTINGGSNRENNNAEGKILNNDLADMKSFIIENKVNIEAELEPLNKDWVAHRTLTAKNGAQILITGNYLDIGENTFIEDGGDFVLENQDIIITNYNNYYGKDEYDDGSVDLYPNYVSVYKPISVDKVIDQFKLLSNSDKPTPKFRIELGEDDNKKSDLFKLSVSLLNNYENFDNCILEIKSGIDKALYTFDNYTEGVPMFNGDEENPNHPSYREENKINLRVAKFVGYIPTNAVLKINGDENITEIGGDNIVNLVVEGDASSVVVSRGITSGFIKTKGQAFQGMQPLYDVIYIHTEYPINNNGFFMGGESTLDFRSIKEGLYSGPRIISSVNVDLYLNEINKNIGDDLLDAEYGGSLGEIYDGTNGYPRSIQDFEEQGNAYLKEKGVIHTSSY